MGLKQYEVRECSPASGAIGGPIRVRGDGHAKRIGATSMEHAAKIWGALGYDGPKILVKSAPEASRGPWYGYLVGCESHGIVDEGEFVQVREIV